MLFRGTIHTDNTATNIILPLIIQADFISEGIRKFLFEEKLGMESFVKVGIPNPDFSTTLADISEIDCGAVVLIARCVRHAGILLLIVILVAIASTNAPLLIDIRIWPALHCSEIDWTMLLGSIFLIFKDNLGYAINRKIALSHDSAPIWLRLILVTPDSS